MMIYERLLDVAATRREEIKQALLGIVKNDSRAMKDQSDSEEWVNKCSYAENIAEIVFSTNHRKNSKKLSEDAFMRLENAFGLIPRLLAFLLAFYNALLYGDVAKLDHFIDNYQNDLIESLSVFVSGLRKDYEAVKNCLLYPGISNGPMGGTNNKIKMIRRRGY